MTEEQLADIDDAIRLMRERMDTGQGDCTSPMCRLSLAMSERLRSALAEARYNARILAHSYEKDCRPPQRVVSQSLGYPVRS